MDEIDLLFNLPRTALVGIAKKQGLKASTAHSKDQLIDAIYGNKKLPPDPISIIRKRIHRAIQKNWSKLKYHIDKECESCFLHGQRECTDFRAVADYLVNLELITIEEKCDG